MYGQTCYISGKVKKALKILDKVISDCTYLFGNNSSELAWSYCYGWNILYSIGDKSNAIQMIQNAYKIYDKLYLGRGTKLAWAALNAGTAAMISGDNQSAEEFYNFSINENDFVLIEEHRPHVYSLTIYSNLAILYEKTNQHTKAIETISFALRHSITKNGASHIYTANILLNYGIIDKSTKKILQAIDLYKKQSIKTPDIFFATICLSRIYALTQNHKKASMVLHECMNLYFSEYRETDFITY